MAASSDVSPSPDSPRTLSGDASDSGAPPLDQTESTVIADIPGPNQDSASPVLNDSAALVTETIADSIAGTAANGTRMTEVLEAAVEDSDDSYDTYIKKVVQELIAGGIRHAENTPPENVSVDAVVEQTIEELVTHAVPESASPVTREVLVSGSGESSSEPQEEVLEAGERELVVEEDVEVASRELPTETREEVRESGSRQLSAGAGEGGLAPVSEPSAPRTARQTRRPRARQRNFFPDVSGLTKKFLAGHHVPCDVPETLAAAVWELEDYRDEALKNGQVNESLKAQQAIDLARGQMMDALKKKSQQEVTEDLGARERESKQEYEKFQQEMREKEKDLEAMLNEQQQDLIQRQHREIEEHDALWKVEPKLRQFNRSSQRLRILRMQQQLLFAAKRFDEAGRVRAIADRLMEADAVQRHEQLNREYAESRALLDKKHQEELDTFQQACQTRRGEFIFEKETQTRRFQHRFSLLRAENDAAKDADRLWIRKHRYDGDQIVNLCGVPRERKTVDRKADVSGFNTLPLPPLVTKGVAKHSKKASRATA
jgi:hypothetical protein